MALEAQQYAAAEGDVIRMKAYTDLANSTKAPITGTHFSKEVSLGSESNYTDTIKKRIATVKIYKDSDSLPCYTLEVPRLSADVNGKGVPIGTVITWASANNPTENGVWLECNGQSCSSYPELAKVLGTNTVPDYRGVFLRGLGSVNSSHYGNVTHQSETLGKLQGDAIRNITGYLSGGLCTLFDSYNMGQSALWDGGTRDGSQIPSSMRNVNPGEKLSAVYATSEGKYPDDVAFDASRVVPTANETRSINRAVRYFIRAA